MHQEGDRFCDQIDFVMNSVVHSKSGNIRAYPVSLSAATATAVAAAGAEAVVVSPYINGTVSSNPSVSNRHRVLLPGEASTSRAHVTPLTHLSSHSCMTTPCSSSSSSSSSSRSPSPPPSPIHFIRSPDSHSSNLMRCRIDINSDDKRVEDAGGLRCRNDDEEKEREREKEREMVREWEREIERDDLRSRRNPLVIDNKRDENVHIISAQKKYRKDYNGYTGHGKRSKSSERLCSSGYSFPFNSHKCSDDVIKSHDILSSFEPCSVRLKKEYDGDSHIPPQKTRSDKQQQIINQSSHKHIVIISPDSPGIVRNEVRKKNTTYGPSGLVGKVKIW